MKSVLQSKRKKKCTKNIFEMNDFLSCLNKLDKKIAVMISDYVPGQSDRAEKRGGEERGAEGRERRQVFTL